MSLTFPSSPSVGQQSAQNGRTYQWSGYAWELVSNVPGHAASHASTGSDPITVTAAEIADAAVTRAKLGAAEQAAISLYLWSNFR